MPSGEEIVEDVADLLLVAAREWLARRATSEHEARQVTEARAARRRRLELLGSRAARVHEVDARIELLEITEGVPDREEHLRRLRQLRKRLLRS